MRRDSVGTNLPGRSDGRVKCFCYDSCPSSGRDSSCHRGLGFADGRHAVAAALGLVLLVPDLSSPSVNSMRRMRIIQPHHNTLHYQLR
jgi:hypothetical protein